MLKELNEIRKNAPECFYNILKSKLSLKCKNNSDSYSNNFQLYDLLKLSYELNEIFKKWLPKKQNEYFYSLLFFNVF